MNTILRHTSMNSVISKIAKHMVSSVLIVFVMTFVAGPNLYGQVTVDCGLTIACNNNTQLSLDINCTETIVADMILKEPAYPNDVYTVVVRKKSGEIIPDNIVGVEHIGMTLEVSVFIAQCGTSCWGNMKIEDKYAPIIENCDPVFISCDAMTDPIYGPTNPLYGVGRPIATDGCGPVTYKQLEDRFIKLGCLDDFAARIERTWIFTDPSGNSSICTQLIYIEHGDLEDIIPPNDYDDLDLPVFSCDDTLELKENGAPTVNETGAPTLLSCHNIQSTNTDILFDLCGNSLKVLRQWEVIDWCSGRDTFFNQIIKILDTVPPLMDLMPDSLVELGTDTKMCWATYEVPYPDAYDCSDFHYAVGYRLKQPDGTFGYTSYENVYQDTNGIYTIHELPQDTSIIVYNLTDECGNTSEYTYRVLVVDDEEPIATCEGYTIVSLKENGWADLWAEAINSGSEDNCEVVRFEIKRLNTSCQSSDLQFGEKVNFCCNDVSTDPGFYVKVVLRVFDAAGNYNDCITNVKVQDKLRPEILCPSDVTIECSEDYTDINVTGGAATATDNCEVTITHRDIPHLTKCNTGYIWRIWTATDGQGLQDSCHQLITIENSNPFGDDYIWFPADTTIDGCYTEEYLTPEALHSKPVFHNSGCAQLALSYEDEYFSVDHACLKIFRKWRVIDWCTYDPDDKIVYSRTQVILVKNTTAPTVTTGCVDRTIVSTEGDCEEVVHHRIEAEDDCTPEDQLRYEWEVDLFSNETIDDKGYGKAVSDNYPVGEHIMIFRVYDDCGNEGICKYIFRITDDKKPSPICIGDLVWVLDEEGKASIWASDFNLKSEDFCGTNELHFAFDDSMKYQVLDFTCEDIPNGIATKIPLKMYVFDSDGNYDYCSVNLILQDSPHTNSCPDNLGDGVVIAGRIVNATQSGGVKGVEVTLSDMTDLYASTSMTNDQGDYSFGDATYYNKYDVGATKTDDVLNGVSTIDLVFIQRHILALGKLDDPYKLIAADANKSGSITSADLVEIRKLLLGKIDNFENYDPWRFVPASYVFEDPKSPYDYPQAIHYGELVVDEVGSDFVLVKTGDVNNSADFEFFASQSVSSRSVLNMESETSNAHLGDEYSLPIIMTEDNRILGFQMELDFDANQSTFLGLESTMINLSDDNFSIDNGKIKISYSIPTGMQISADQPLFEIKFRAKQSGVKMLNLGADVLNAEMYSEEGEVLNLNLRNRNNNTINTGELEVLASPNPFRRETSLSIDLDKGGLAKIRIIDITGKVIYNTEELLYAGHNTHSITDIMLNDNEGIYFYQIEVFDQTKNGKLILLK